MKTLKSYVLVLILLTGGLAYASEPTLEPIPPSAEPTSYLRVGRENGRVDLEIAVRKFVSDQSGQPVVWLVGVTHIGDQSYFDKLQAFLDAQELVLFEGVGRPPFADAPSESDTDEVRAQRTRSAVEFAASQAQWHYEEFGKFPESLPALLVAVKGHQSNTAKYLRMATKADGWGRELQYATGADTFTITSYGSDGAAGGESLAADIVESGTAPEPSGKAEEPEGMQNTLARGLGLKFQLDAIDYDREKWVNSDMPARQMQEVFSAAMGGEGDAQEMKQMMELLQGNGMLAGVMRFAAGFLGKNPVMQGYVKVMMAEVLGTVGDRIGELPGAPESQKKLMKVLVEDRNQVVVDDLKKVLAGGKPPASIAIFYGAAHLRDMETRLGKQLGYKPAGQFWLVPFGVNIKESGLNEDQLSSIRVMIQAQLGKSEPKPKAEPKTDEGGGKPEPVGD